jgi:transposase
MGLIRNVAFQGTSIYQDIFDEIVLQAMDKGLIEGKELFTDSTFLIANAARESLKPKKSRPPLKPTWRDANE